MLFSEYNFFTSNPLCQFAAIRFFTADEGIAGNSAARTICTHFLRRRNRGSLAILFAEEIGHLGERSKSPPQPQRIARFWCTQRVCLTLPFGCAANKLTICNWDIVGLLQGSKRRLPRKLRNILERGFPGLSVPGSKKLEKKSKKRRNRAKNAKKNLKNCYFRLVFELCRPQGREALGTPFQTFFLTSVEGERCPKFETKILPN